MSKKLPPRTHPWQPRRVLKEKSQDANGLLIIKMGRAEQLVRLEIATEQVSMNPNGPLAKWIREQKKGRKAK